MKEQKRFNKNNRTRFLGTQTVDIMSTAEDPEIFVCSVASELPVCVGEYYEILDIQSMDITRLVDGGCVLFDHDPKNYIGVVVSAWKEGTKLYAKFRFASHAFAQQVKQDVTNGILNKISIGYSITSFAYDSSMDGMDVMRCGSMATEFSIVTVPADMTVGIGRSLTKRDLQEQINELNNNESESEKMEEILKLINDLNAKLDAMQKSLDEVKESTKKTEPSNEEMESERKKREMEDTVKKEDEEEKRKRALEDENGDVVADDVANAPVDQTVIDEAVADIAEQVADATDAEVNVDDIIADIQEQINDVVDENVEELDEEVV